jgi:hypothetical protein
MAGKVSAAVMTATACSQVSDRDGRPSRPLGCRRGRPRCGDEIAGFGAPDGALEGQVTHGDRRGGVAGGHRRQGLPDVVGGQVAELPGAG